MEEITILEQIEQGIERRKFFSFPKEVRKKYFDVLYKYKPFHNRKLGFENMFLVDIENYIGDAAEIALSNMNVGEYFYLYGKKYTVLSIKKSITFDIDGIKKRVNINGEKFLRLRLEINGLLLSYPHGIDCYDLITALKRDPMYINYDFRRPTIFKNIK